MAGYPPVDAIGRVDLPDKDQPDELVGNVIGESGRIQAGCAQGTGAARIGRGSYVWQGIPRLMQSAR